MGDADASGGLVGGENGRGESEREHKEQVAGTEEIHRGWSVAALPQAERYMEASEAAQKLRKQRRDCAISARVGAEFMRLRAVFRVARFLIIGRKDFTRRNRCGGRTNHNSHEKLV